MGPNLASIFSLKLMGVASAVSNTSLDQYILHIQDFVNETMVIYVLCTTSHRLQKYPLLNSHLIIAYINSQR